jgi:uncharacterized membrane protein
MRQVIMYLAAMMQDNLQTAGFNIPLLLILILILIIALVVCHRLVKKFHLYENKKEHEILEHT